MSEVKSLDRKRLCDISTDQRVIKIGKKDCVTRITANPDGTRSCFVHWDNNAV